MQFNRGWEKITELKKVKFSKSPQSRPKWNKGSSVWFNSIQLGWGVGGRNTLLISDQF